jgi:phenylpyruvate tautomerase PptA (4-oxalocrotonate tautomerase family)
MPNLEVTLPKTDASKRKLLCARLTDAVIECTGFEREDFGVVLHEYDHGQAAMGGVLWDGNNTPYLHLVLYCPRLSHSAKRKLVKSLSAAFAECLDQPGWLPIIHLCEHPYDNVGWKGELLSDKFDELAKRKYYYDLPKD